MESAGETSIPGEISFSEPKLISTVNGGPIETQDKDIIMEGLGAIGVYDKWVAPPISGQQPKPRYQVNGWQYFIDRHDFKCSYAAYWLFFFVVMSLQHGAAVVKDKMYIFGGNHNGRYLNDLQVYNSF